MPVFPGFLEIIRVVKKKIRKDSGILEALDEACLVNNVSRVEYLRLAVAERLKEEGYETGYKTSSTNNA